MVDRGGIQSGGKRGVTVIWIVGLLRGWGGRRSRVKGGESGGTCKEDGMGCSRMGGTANKIDRVE